MKLENFQGLECVIVLNIPTKVEDGHKVLAFEHGDIEKMASKIHLTSDAV